MAFTYAWSDSDQKVLKRTNSDNGSVAWIPTSSANTDYQEYLEWVAEGNTPDPAE